MEQVVQVAAAAAQSGAAKQRDRERARRAEALQLRLMGASYDAIGERLGISGLAAKNMIERALDQAERQGVAQLRAEENARLDRAQMAIWTDVLQGDLKAIQTFLQISSQRSKINGLYAPSQVQVSMTIRQEMEDALQGLEALVLQEPVMVLEERRDVAVDAAAEDHS